MGTRLDGLRVLVTRPAGRADSLQAALRSAGAEVRHRPLLRIVALDPVRDVALVAAGRRRILELDGYRRVIFVSVNAVHHGLDWCADYWPQWPVGVHWYGVGAATAAALEEQGLPARHPGGSMTSEDLLAMPELAAVRGERILIVRGAGGRNQLAQTLTQRGARVDYLECYRREPAHYDPGAFCEELRCWAPQAVCLNSGETLAHYHALLSAGGEAASGWSATLVLPAERVAHSARALGFSRMLVAANAGDAATLEALRGWWRHDAEEDRGKPSDGT